MKEEEAAHLTMTLRLASLRGRWLMPVILSTTAGAVDVICFLALGGLFTAHITGNLVIVAAHFVTGRFSQVGPLLAVPVFIAVLGAVTLAVGRIEKAGSGLRRALLVLHAVLLAGCLGVGAGLGPFPNADSPAAVFGGMLGVAAMATQSALVKVAFEGAPSTVAMTTNVTMLAIDLAAIIRARGESEEIAKVRGRATVVFLCVAGFLGGCVAGAVLEGHVGLWALLLPVVLAVLAIPLSELWNDSPILDRR
jgi:uncharacterized membrane protein YoaK (UPF0700 family)